jgi:2-dehydro-3-deoxyphosphogalactonate aldolase
MSTDHVVRFNEAFEACPLIAILRGVRPDEVLDIGEALLTAGFRIIEVPLNSPSPFESIGMLVERFGDRAVIGAGTVTQHAEIGRLAATGAGLAVSPHSDPGIISATRKAGLAVVPGAMSPTEAFVAFHAGATALKLFPMEMIGASGVKAMRAVLPKELQLIAVGGVEARLMPTLTAAGCAGFGLGGALYKPGDAPARVAEKAAEFIAALDRRE